VQGGRDPPKRDTALQDAFGQLLDKKRHAVGAVDDLVDDLVRQRLAAGDLVDQGGPIMLVEPIERQHRHLRLAGPRRLELGAERHDQEHRQAADPLDQNREQFA
jgi:hypothetical protein